MLRLPRLGEFVERHGAPTTNGYGGKRRYACSSVLSISQKRSRAGSAGRADDDHEAGGGGAQTPTRRGFTPGEIWQNDLIGGHP